MDTGPASRSERPLPRRRGHQPRDADETIVPAKMDRDVHLSSDFTSQILRPMHTTNVLQRKCESHLKVAFQGLRKSPTAGRMEKAAANSTTPPTRKSRNWANLFGGRVDPDRGRAPGTALQHDPLGLDKAMQYVVEASDDGRCNRFARFGHPAAPPGRPPRNGTGQKTGAHTSGKLGDLKRA